MSGPLRQAPAELKRDRDFMMEAVSRCGIGLGHASPDLQSDYAIVMAAVSQNGRAIQYASPDLQSNFDIVMAAVSQNGFALQYASPDRQSDHEIVMAAVSQDGEALQYASEELQSHHDIVIAAVSQSWRALRPLSQELRSERGILATTAFGSPPQAVVLKVSLLSGRSYTHLALLDFLGLEIDVLPSALRDCAYHLGLDETLAGNHGKFITSDGIVLTYLDDLQPGRLHEVTLVISPEA